MHPKCVRDETLIDLENVDMVIKNFDEYIKIKRKHPYAFIEYEGDDLFENDNDDEEIDVTTKSLFEKYKKELEAKNKKTKNDKLE